MAGAIVFSMRYDTAYCESGSKRLCRPGKTDSLNADRIEAQYGEARRRP